MTPPLFRRRPRVDADDITPGSRWRLHWSSEHPSDVTVLGTNHEGPWYGGYGIRLDSGACLSVAVFIRIAEPLTPA